MNLSMGVVGLPNVGKSTLFHALTKNQVNIANYPFATIDPNVGIVPVLDERLNKVAELSKSQKITPAVVEFYDIAGLVKGAHKGEGLGNQFLNQIRQVSAIVMVVRCFQDDNIIHVDGSVDPLRDIETIHTELVFKDLELIEKRLVKAESMTRSGRREDKDVHEKLLKIRNILESTGRATDVDKAVLKELDINLLTAKKVLYFLNGNKEDVDKELLTYITDVKGEYITRNLSAENVDLNEFVQGAYKTLGLISFFTAGDKESRSWTIREGAQAPEAAGAIHSDFEEKFIRAEVVNWEKLLESEGWSKAKSRGWIRVEGKEYVVQDGDVMLIRHG